jgi:two-component system sensor histidine kinase/response regulator
MNENHVLVEVKDTGKGIKSEYLTNIFNSKMNESSETKEERWKGLGLLFCKDFVEIHGGNITIDSEEGKGTSIKFTLKQF